MKKWKAAATAAMLVATTTVAGCASSPSEIAPTYVSPMMFATMDCYQLNGEARRLNSRLSAAVGQQQQQANNDAAMTAVSLFLFWPAMFMVGGNDQSGAISQMRGEAQALHDAAVSRGCPT